MTLERIYKQFKKQEDCIRFLELLLWNNKPKCPYCGSKRNTPMQREHRYHCGGCRVSYSVTARTMFNKTKIDLQKWFYAIILVREKISIRKLAEQIDVTKDTASFIIKRIKIAHTNEPDLLNKFYEIT